MEIITKLTGDECSWDYNWVSCHSENTCNCLVSNGSRRTPGANESAHNTQQHDKNDWLGGKEEDKVSSNEQILLQDHGIGYNDTNENAKETWRKNQNAGFVEKEHSDAVLCESHCSQHSNFLLLLVQVGTHRSREREERQKHGNANQRQKHFVQYSSHKLSLVLFLGSYFDITRGTG